MGDYDKRTPLHLASSAGHIDIVKYLIDEGANVSPRDRWGATPLNDAKDSKIIEYLKSHGAERGIEQKCPVVELPPLSVTDD